MPFNKFTIKGLYILINIGILLPNEKKIMEQLTTSHSTYWMPLVWASSIAIRARKEGRIRDDFALNTLVEVSL